MSLVISKTPLRISLCGGGTDMDAFASEHTGKVISCGIDKYVYVIVKERFDDLIVLNYTKHEIVSRIEDIKHDLIRQCMLLCGIDKGVEITTLADIPSEGSGLGSSSAITVGLLNALQAFDGYQITPETSASWACDIEIGLLNKPIGRQDQYACAHGNMKYYKFLKDKVVSYYFGLTNEKLAQISNNLFLHYTGITRDANVILADQGNKMSENLYGLFRLCHLTDKLKRAIFDDDYGMIGYALKEGWNLKRNFASGITNEAIDKMIDTAYFGGATGVKLCGAGGGGFLLSYVPRNRQADFLTAMAGYRELPFNIDPHGTRIIFNQ